MKASLLAVMALFAMNFSAHANEVVQLQDELVPADELATMDGIDANATDESADDMDISIYHPGHPGHPGHPHPAPHPHPHPHPVPHPHPHPHPVPPPTFWYECSSYDRFNNWYVGRGTNPVVTQRNIHNRCEYESQGYCYDNGCRRI